MSRRALIAANWKMHGTVASVGAYLETLIGRVGPRRPRGRALPAVHAAPGGAAARHRVRGRGRRPELPLGGQGRVHRRGGRADAGGARRALGHRRSFRATSVLCRDRRNRGGAGTGGAARRPRGDLLPRGDARSARGRHDARGARTAERGARRPRPRRLAVAYEPVWAIGTGRTATTGAGAGGARGAPRGGAAELLGAEAAAALRILYGGSVKPDNAAALLAEEDVDGALVGGASLDVEAFSAIIHAAPGERRGAGE